MIIKLIPPFLPGPSGCKLISVCILNQSTVLTELTISGNGIGPVGVQHLVDGVMGNRKCKLTVLDLSYNRLTDAGAHALVPMLRSKTFLINLCVNGNELTDDGASAIFNALCSPSNENDVTSDAGSIVSKNPNDTPQQLLNSEKPTALRQLQCGFNPAIGDAVMESVGLMLLENHSMVG